MFKSVTTWGVKDWLIRVTIDGFATIEEAAVFGRSKTRYLIKEPGVNYLILELKNGARLKVFDKEIAVSKLKPEYYGKTMWDDAAYRDSNTPIKEFDRMLDSNLQFEELFFEVLDQNNNSLDLANMDSIICKRARG